MAGRRRVSHSCAGGRSAAQACSHGEHHDGARGGLRTIAPPRPHAKHRFAGLACEAHSGIQRLLELLARLELHGLGSPDFDFLTCTRIARDALATLALAERAEANKAQRIAPGHCLHDRVQCHVQGLLGFGLREAFHARRDRVDQFRFRHALLLRMRYVGLKGQLTILRHVVSRQECRKCSKLLGKLS
ncbi:protein of unknown function (plasmid) [Cupriavidus taiwanensis]|uniref:Uncharacterized protein n=1 Tax=Cupriavidus taiwanensis TaxID=164546 RepID=A0A375ITM6_9BURK|nr:protein of unknown function [Cupriavidus taiwanensis]